MDTTKRIEAYLDGSLRKEDQDELESLARKDKELSDLILLHREVNESIRDTNLHFLRSKLKKISTERRVLLFRRHFRIVASLICLLALGTTIKVVFFHSSSSVALFQKYYVRYEPDVTYRTSGKSNSDLEKALLFYESRNYTLCAQLLDRIILNEKRNYIALFYRGLTSLELKSSEEAISTLLAIPQNWLSPYAEHRDWYLALSLIKAGREKEALPILKQLASNNTLYSVKSRAILHKLRN
jgi:hypothetical protein